MNNLMQPKGSVAIETNKQSIARMFSLKIDDIWYITISKSINEYIILYDPVSQMWFYKGNATGTAISWSEVDEKLTLVTTDGIFLLQSAKSGSSVLKDI